MEQVKSKKEVDNKRGKKSPVFFSQRIQKKLSVGSVNDSFELEADHMANLVMRMSASRPHTGAVLQSKCSSCGQVEELQRKEIKKKISPFGQQAQSSDSNRFAPSHVEKAIYNSLGKGSNMDSSTKNFMEKRFGLEFSDVKIHSGSEAIKMSRDLNAHAFTVGKNIYFNEGKYNPNTESGKYLLAHELTHTIQQSGGAHKFLQRSCGDKAANWYNPFIRITSYDPSCFIQYANLNRSTITNLSTDWQRNALNTGLFSAFAGMATTVIGRRLGLSQMMALAFGGAVGGARGYLGMTAKERIRGKTVVMNNWYGRYKYNAYTKELLAVEYVGKGNDVLNLVSPWYFEEALFDAENNIVGNYIHKNIMHMPGVPLTGDILPEKSFGVI